ncbi:IQ calmodulin-binding protein, putative [Bodo saltans]|uniref:IQ calmodulin-binding protein, putative n=1 Tax=Bodo saltans TaxID=75058 RepID=A0A0S4J5P2_BODSA|nr:IQ calmodulin-binding protein, putative [Bodo saltans]|eukprot:CUG83324.1 IQ calmodulin-binding protein, putative [Bodo saltans]
MTDGGAASRPNVMLTGSLAGQRAASHIGQPTLPLAVLTDIKKRLHSTQQQQTSAVIKNAEKLVTAPQQQQQFLTYLDMPWDSDVAGSRLQRHWLSTSLNNFGCMLRMQRMYNDAASLFRCAAYVDASLASVALVNLSATFLMLEKRTEAAEVARFVVRVCTAQGSSTSNSGTDGAQPPPSQQQQRGPGGGGGKSSSNLNQYRFHREQVAAVHPKLVATVLSLAQHCLGTVMETVDDVAALDSYRSSVATLKSPAVLTSNASAFLGVVEGNLEHYVKTLDSLQTAMNGPPSPPPPSSSSVHGESSISAQPPSSTLLKSRSFRKMQQATLVNKAVNAISTAGQQGSLATSGSTTGGAQQQQQQQQQSTGQFGNQRPPSANNNSSSQQQGGQPPGGPQLHYVPDVPKTLWKSFRDQEGLVSTYLPLLDLEEEPLLDDSILGSHSTSTPPPPPTIGSATAAHGGDIIAPPDSPLQSNLSKHQFHPTNNNSMHSATYSHVGGGSAPTVAGSPAMSYITVAGGGSVNTQLTIRLIAQRALCQFMVCIDGETVCQRMGAAEFRRVGVVVTGVPSGPTTVGGGQATGGSNNNGPRPPAGDAPPNLARKKSVVMKEGAAAAAAAASSSSPTASPSKSAGGRTNQQQSNSPTGGGGGSPTKNNGSYLVPPKVPPTITADALVEENKKKDDVVSFLASRLTQLLRVEEYHNAQYVAAIRIQWFIRPLIARRVMRLRREKEERGVFLEDLKRNAASARISRFFRRVLAIRKRVRDQREKHRLLVQQRRNAIIVFQKYTRRWNAIQLAHRLRRRQIRETQCALQLQRWARLCLARGKRSMLAATSAAALQHTKNTAWWNKCAQKIQALYRAHRTYIWYLITQGLHDRALRLDRQKFLTTRAITIQRWVRGHQTRRKYAKTVNPARIRARNAYQSRRKNEAAAAIQKIFRGYIARHFGRFAPLVLEARKRGKQLYAARLLAKRAAACVKIQGLVRGYLTRRRGPQAAVDQIVQKALHSSVRSVVVLDDDDDDENNYFIGMRKGYGESKSLEHSETY